MTGRTRDRACDDAPRRAKLFWNGRSQAVRLPKAFRFSGSEVEIQREREAVVLEPVRKRAWPDGHWRWLYPRPAGIAAERSPAPPRHVP